MKCHDFLALLDIVSRATVMAQASVISPLTQVSQKPLHGSRPNFMESYLPYLQTIFSFFKIFYFHIFTIFISISLTWDPNGAKISKHYFSHNFDPISTKFMTNMIVMGEYRLLLFLAICQKIIFYGTLKFFLTQDHMQLEISKGYFSYSFHLMLAKLYEDIG